MSHRLRPGGGRAWAQALAKHAGIAYNLRMQYTVRGIPEVVDKAVRERAREEGKSLNEVTVEALADGLGLGEESIVRRDLSDIVGTWKREVSVDAALAAQDIVDEALWR